MINSNIKILVITDNLEEWLEHFMSNLSNNVKSKKYDDTYYISDGLFNVEIRSKYPLNIRGACYSCCILDKFLGHDIQDCILEPCIKGYLQYTPNYYKQWEELGNDYNKQDFGF